jgi:hypothetical protein
MVCRPSPRVLSAFALLWGATACSDYSLNETNKDEALGAHILVEPTQLTYNIEAVTDVQVKSFTITNVGNATLEIHDIVLSGSSDFTLLTDWWPTAMLASETVELEVSLIPSGAESVGEVLVQSSDVYEPEVVVDLFGNSLEVPVAVCEARPATVEPLVDPVTWWGEDSFDNTGGTLVSWDWTLISSPSGSAVSMPGGGANRTGFYPDLAGEYIGQLIVTNDSGMQSAPCRTTVMSAPDEDMWIEMYWTHPGDDMDLHLIAPGGFYEDGSSWDNDTDCHWRNCTWSGVDWGSASSTDDDPSLDLDDITGTGPENINIKSPTNGTYTIAVHDYPGSSYEGSNPVTMNVYLNGTLEWTDTRPISGEDTVTYFAEIAWTNSAGVVTPR